MKKIQRLRLVHVIILEGTNKPNRVEIVIDCGTRHQEATCYRRSISNQSFECQSLDFNKRIIRTSSGSISSI